MLVWILALALARPPGLHLYEVVTMVRRGVPDRIVAGTVRGGLQRCVTPVDILWLESEGMGRRGLEAVQEFACASADPEPAPPAHGDHGHHGDHGDHATVEHRFDDAEEWAKVFDDPERDAWQKPALVIEAMAIAPGMAVADIGAGTGYFNPHLARAVGPEGAVIAIDVEATLVAHMAERARTEATPQVEARLGAFADPGLKPAEVDRILLVDTYHHISERKAYFSALRSTLKPGGRLIVVDFGPGELPVGPPPDHKLPKEQVVEELRAAGWTLEAGPDGLPYQYLLVFTPS